MDTQQAATLFECLSSKIRLEIFLLLTKYGRSGLVAGQISEELGVSASNLSFHLKNLSHCGLVSVEQEGRFLRYRANLEMMQAITTFLTNECCIYSDEDRCC